MRSIFQDTEVQAKIEQNKLGGSRTLPVVTCIIAMIFAASVWGLYIGISTKPPPPPPPPPVSLSDGNQTEAAFNLFNSHLRAANFVEAEKMLSTNALNKLKSENKPLRDSILGANKDTKLVLTDPTPSGEVTDLRIVKDHYFTFENGQSAIVSLELIIENGKIVVNGWGEEAAAIAPTPTPTPEPTPSPKKASNNISRGKRR